MTEINQTDGSNAFPPKTTQRALRLRIIPGTFLAIVAWIGAVDMLFVSSFTPSIIVICLQIVVAGMSAFAWFYKKWRLAWIGTFICLALMLAPTWLGPV